MNSIEVAHAGKSSVTIVKKNQRYYMKYPDFQEELPKNNSWFSPVQKSMFDRLTLGRSAYSIAELEAFSEYSLKRIDIDHQKADREIYLLKIELLMGPINNIFKAIYKNYNSKYCPELYSREYGDMLLKGINPTKYGLTDKLICERLVKSQLLPDNFFNL